ncbi:MAG: hypothetical protein IIX45_04895 [Lachnospiraceae bacterium]|nr:hypothetical protein [Lachnospiraceae bacterium]
MAKFFACLTKRMVMIPVILGIVLFAISIGNTLVSFKEAVGFEELMEKDVEVGTHIKGEINFTVGPFASEDTETTHKDGSKTVAKDTAQYYLVFGGEKTQFLGLKVNKDDNAEVAKNASETNAYLSYETDDEPSTTPMYEGKVEEMDPELAIYFKDYLLALGFTYSEINDMGDFLCIIPIYSGNTRMVTVAGLVLILIGILAFVLNFKKLLNEEKNTQEANTTYNINSYGQQQNGAYDMNGYGQQQNGAYDMNGYGQQQNGAYDMNGYDQSTFTSENK